MCWGLCTPVLDCKSFERMLSGLPLYPAQHPAKGLADDRQSPINIGGAVLVSDPASGTVFIVPFLNAAFLILSFLVSLPVSSSSVGLSSGVPGGVAPGSVIALSRVFTVRELSGCDKKNQGSSTKP